MCVVRESVCCERESVVREKGCVLWERERVCVVRDRECKFYFCHHVLTYQAKVAQMMSWGNTHRTSMIGVSCLGSSALTRLESMWELSCKCAPPCLIQGHPTLCVVHLNCGIFVTEATTLWFSDYIFFIYLLLFANCWVNVIL